MHCIPSSSNPLCSDGALSGADATHQAQYSHCYYLYYSQQSHPVRWVRIFICSVQHIPFACRPDDRIYRTVRWRSIQHCIRKQSNTIHREQCSDGRDIQAQPTTAVSQAIISVRKQHISINQLKSRQINSTVIYIVKNAYTISSKNCEICALVIQDFHHTLRGAMDIMRK